LVIAAPVAGAAPPETWTIVRHNVTTTKHFPDDICGLRAVTETLTNTTEVQHLTANDDGSFHFLDFETGILVVDYDDPTIPDETRRRTEALEVNLTPGGTYTETNTLRDAGAVLQIRSTYHLTVVEAHRRWSTSLGSSEAVHDARLPIANAPAPRRPDVGRGIRCAGTGPPNSDRRGHIGATSGPRTTRSQRTTAVTIGPACPQVIARIDPGTAGNRDLPVLSRTEEVSGPLGLTRELRRSASALMRHRPKRGAQAQPRCKRGWPPAIPGREGADGTNGRERGMILSILVTLAFVATLLWMLVRAFTGPIRHRHRRPVYH
jgi:hypothetical protein